MAHWPCSWLHIQALTEQHTSAFQAHAGTALTSLDRDMSLGMQSPKVFLCVWPSLV